MKNNSIFFDFNLSMLFSSGFWLKLLFVIITFVALTLLMLFQDYNSVTRIKISDVVSKDIVVDEDMNYIDEKASARNEEILSLSNVPCYFFNVQYSDERLNVLGQLLAALESNVQFETVQDIAAVNKMNFSENEFKVLSKIIREDRKFTDTLEVYCSKVYKNGVIHIDSRFISRLENTGILLFYSDESGKVDEKLTKEQALELELDFKVIQRDVEIMLPSFGEFEKRVLENFLINFFQPNIILDAEKTQTNLKEKLQRERNVYKKIQKGQIIARRGDLVTEDNLPMINAVLQNQKSITTRNICSYALLNLLLFIFSFAFIHFIDSSFFKSTSNIIFLMVLYLVFVIYLMIPFTLDRSNYYFGALVPISMITITMIFLYSKIFAATITMLFSVTCFIISGYNASAFLFVFLSGICSILTIKHEIRRRSDLLISGIYVAILNAVIAFTLAFVDGLETVAITKFAFFGACNGFVSSVFAIGLIALGESLLNLPTVFRLQELTDTSLPLLKELSESAMGSYIHSINVANLAETAANAVHANGLLAKVGALYHDIGKIGNAAYFTENQGDYNPHNDLPPMASVNIIKNHVKDGMERAKIAKLPQKVIDIIHQHHGNGLIKYFYYQALKQLPEGESISEDTFRYKAENPQFPEAAIVMMADQIEAISRANKDYTKEGFKGIVEKVVEEKIKDETLTNAELTIRDLTKLKQVFTKSLIGMYHSRIEYPAPPSAVKNESNTVEEVTKRNG